MKYSTIIFDLDGTLLDTSEGIMAGASYTANKMGLLDLSTEQQKSFIGPPVMDSFIRECGFTVNQARQAVEIYRQRYKEKGLYEAKHYNQVKELLITLKKEEYKTGVATLKRDDFAKSILKHFELSNYLDCIKGIDDQDIHSKSDIIKMCLKELNEEDLSNVVLIGDSIYDAMGADQVGIDFIAVTYGYGYKDKQEADKVRNVLVAENVIDIINYLI
ncbi:HAD hydrolase-like protein [Bacillus sp. MM2020_1]|nr:HAD hydrolase-like protein [Bacillus sp. MM2020_1]